MARTITTTLLIVLFQSISSAEARQLSNAGVGTKKSTARVRPTSGEQQESVSLSSASALRGGYTSNGPLNRPQQRPTLFSGGSTTTLIPAPEQLNGPLPRKDGQVEGDWFDGDLFLPSHLQDDETNSYRPHGLATYVDNLRQQVEERSQEAEKATSATQQQQETQSTNSSLTRLDLALFGTYFCTAVAMTIPIMVMPLVAAEHAAGTQLSVAAIVATIASISTLGGGIGKILNGFVCKYIGGTRSSWIYLVGLAAASLGLSLGSAANAGGILALVEFFASIQWAACSLVFANHYKDPARFAKGITILSLASTSGQIVAKMGGAALLKMLPSWRSLAQLAGITALVGAVIAKTFISEHPVTHQGAVQSHSNSEEEGILESIKAVLGSYLFWQVGIAHATATLARTSDRILGTFFHQATTLPRTVCGGLTAFVTIGFVHGLVSGRKFHQLPNIHSKKEMLSKKYAISTLCAVGMAVCSNGWIQDHVFPSKIVLAAIVAGMTGVLASNISFQFYQLPAMTAKTFGKNKAVAMSLFDGLGLLFAAPVWAGTGSIVMAAGQHGWTLAWLMLAGMFGAGGKIMLGVLPSVILKQKQQQQRAEAIA